MRSVVAGSQVRREFKQGRGLSLRKKKLIFLLGIVLAVTCIGQALNKNALAIFPLIGSIAFFISAWKYKG